MMNKRHPKLKAELDAFMQKLYKGTFYNIMVNKYFKDSKRTRADTKLRADRATGFKGKLAARVWEKQKRGLAHLHGVISVESAVHIRWAEAYVTALRGLAPRYGFGFVDGWHKVGRKFWPGVQL